jgi:hypothetical protein
MSSESEIVERSEETTLGKTIGTVTPAYRGRPDSEMNAIGLGYAALLAILLLPLLPFAAVIWVVWRVASAIRSFPGEGESTEPTAGATRRRGRVS